MLMLKVSGNDITVLGFTVPEFFVNIQFVQASSHSKVITNLQLFIYANEVLLFQNQEQIPSPPKVKGSPVDVVMNWAPSGDPNEASRKEAFSFVADYFTGLGLTAEIINT